jgi:diguanylate cyclase (GGDEF)-like protein
MRLNQLVSELMPGALARKPKLLVVDDQTINIQVMYQAFSEDCQVFMATSGAQALQICKDNPPDLVLLDVVMSGMDGFEVCTQLKSDALTALIPVIFVTAHSDESMETHGLSLGAVDFIFKPINPSVVRARVKTHLTLKFQSDLLRSLVFRDGLTGAFNRRFFDEQLIEEWARSGRTHSPLSLIMIDVDFFKKYNDRYGHQSGDDCLRAVSQTLQAGLKRTTDRVARYGGEEFVCILPDTSFESAMDIAHQLEQAVRALKLVHAESDAAAVVTVSLGVATRGAINDTTTSDDLLALADAQLYAAKKSGRAMVCGRKL